MTPSESPSVSHPGRLWTIVVPCIFLMVTMFNLTLIVAGLKELVIDELGGTARDVSLFFSIEMVAYIIFAPLWGLVSDRIGRRRPLIVTGFLMSAILYASYSLIESVGLLLTVRFVQGAFTVMGWSLLMATVLDHPDVQRRGRSMGLMGGALIFGVSLGAPLGGYISRAWGPWAPLQLSAVLFLVLTVGSVVLRDSRSLESQMTLSEIFGALAARPRLLLPSMFYFADRYSVSFLVVLFPLYLASMGVEDPAVRGRVLGFFLLPFAFLQYLSGRLMEKIDPYVPLIVGSLIYGLVLCLVGYSDLYMLSIVMLILGVLASIMFPPAMLLTAQLSEPGTRGIAMGGFNLAGSLGFAVGPVVGVWAFQTRGYGFAFILAGSLEIVVAIVGLALWWRWRADAR